MTPANDLHPLKGVAFVAAVILLFPPFCGTVGTSSKTRDPASVPLATARASLWQNPTDISSRDLYYGPGGKEHAPCTTFIFLKEDLSGSNPKFDVRDENGNKWRVKLGSEARPEVVASRLVWAIGYYANEDYFVPELHVEQLQRLKRGRKMVGADGTIHNARLKRFPKEEKKLGDWRWSDNPFSGQRELNGLRVMMALLNNWDLKDVNNSIYEEKEKQAADPELHYVVSDLGSSFGTTGISWSLASSKGNLKSYQHSKFITKVTPDYVDFNVPTRPAIVHVFTTGDYFRRLQMRWIGEHIPRSDARWTGRLLAQLSAEQVRDAFRAAGYSADQVAGFAAVVEQRIAELKRL